jgi:long-chain acyl-CoA synthetase
MGNKWNKNLDLKKYESLAAMVLDTIHLHGPRISMRWWIDDECTNLGSITYNELGEKMKNVFGGLKSLGYIKNDHIAVCSETRPEWVYSDLGIQALGASTTAVYPSLKPKEMLYILKDSETKAIFVDELKPLDKIISIWKDISDLKHIFVFHEITDELTKKYGSNTIMTLKDLMEKGAEFNNQNPKAFMKSVKAIDEETLASLIYTSGTTGIPKGVMLSNKNFLSMAYMSTSVVATMVPGHQKPHEMDFLCILPMSHSFGRGCDEYSVLYAGASMNFSGGFNPFKVKKSFEHFLPTILLAVPYFFQKIYNMVYREVNSMPPKIQRAFNKAIKIGHQYHTNIQEGRKNPFKLKFKYATLRKIVARVVNKKLGGKVLGMISGSAAISNELMIFFATLDIAIVQGYGLTETSPVTHICRTRNNSDFRPNFTKKLDIHPYLDSIGPLINVVGSPYELMEQKLSEDGELLLKGPQIMKSYWKKPKLTADIFDKDGWFRTGDLCTIDENGYVRITGRAKLVIKLQTAKMISPAAIETLVIPTSKIVAQFVLAGDDTRKYITCFVVPYQKPLKEYADKNGIKYETWSDLIHNKEIQTLIKDEIMGLTEDVSDYVRPKKFALSSAAFTAKEGYITPSYKFKRKKLFADMKQVLDQLYDNKDEFLVIEERMTGFYDQSLIIG